ncbi:hypothetical protein [Rummeliibacillus sp. SL167]|uniref:hypothetical protein n=1 Tax=Rummeliibacillus sp. SL167 TaxID=2579792 RepID=UPI0011B553E5|nr:hypothetical protein [Rummeliibacillus sp. SL167]
MTNHEKTKQLKKAVMTYATSDTRKSIMQIINTILPMLLLWVAAYWIIPYTVLGAIGLSILAVGFVVRTFIIFHDCTHGSFFKNKRVNNIVGFKVGQNKKRVATKMLPVGRTLEKKSASLQVFLYT